MRRSHQPRLTAYQAGLIALIVLVVAVFLGASKDIPFTRPFELKAAFENAPPIYKGQSVRIAGVDVGKVSGVEPVGGDSPAVVVKMKLKDEALPIHRTRRSRCARACSSRATCSSTSSPARRRPATWTTATRSPCPRPRRRCSSTRCSGSSRPTRAPTSRSSWWATATRSTASRSRARTTTRTRTRRARPPASR